MNLPLSKAEQTVGAPNRPQVVPVACQAGSPLNPRIPAVDAQVRHDTDPAIRLLLVEDDPDSRSATQLMLEKRGVLVSTAVDAEEALHAFDPARFDVVVSDIRLDGMNGVRLLGRIRAQWPDFPVILLTGYDSIESAVQAVRLGAQDYILKPLDAIDDLLVPVRKAVRAHRLLIRNRLLEADLVESREFGFSLLNNSPNPVVVLNPDTSIRYANPALEAMTGWPASAYVGRKAPYPWWRADSPLQDPADLARTMHAGPVNREERIVGAKGEDLWAEISFVPVKRDGALLYCLTNWVNVTERRRAADALRASQDMLRSLAAYIESVRENERTRIAREIHDELGHRLAGLKMDLAWISRKLEHAAESADLDEARRKLQATGELVDGTIYTVRRISAELRPGLLDNLGLAAAVEWQVQQFQSRTGIRCETSGCDREYPLTSHQTTAIFRVLEEVLANVAQHAAASEVSVALALDDAGVRMRVRDNGRGIPAGRANSPCSLGILGMRERLRMLKGVFDIRAAPGQGTIVEVQVPLADIPSSKSILP